MNISLSAKKRAELLLKNNGALPLSGREGTITVIGPHANNPRYYFGGYTPEYGGRAARCNELHGRHRCRRRHGEGTDGTRARQQSADG